MTNLILFFYDILALMTVIVLIPDVATVVVFAAEKEKLQQNDVALRLSRKPLSFYLSTTALKLR